MERNITDTEYLSEKAYKDKTLLEKRRALYRFTRPHYIIEKEVIKSLYLSNEQNVLDVGCGTGKFLLKAASEYPGCRFVGIDISSEIFNQAEREAREQRLNIDFKVGDVQKLPFPDNFFDRVVGMHMIYHVPNIGKTLAEISRVIRPGGKLVLTVNSLRSKPTLQELKGRVARLIGVEEYPDTTLRFNMECGEHVIRKHFTHVRLVPYENKLVLRNPGPYVDYFDSTREFWNPYPEDCNWADALALVRNRIQREIDTKGKFEETNLFGAFIATQ